MTSPKGGTSSGKPSFEWDTGALRVTWANRSALAFWNARSLAELTARTFAPNGSVAKALRRQSELLNESGVGAGWTVFSPDAEMVICRISRSHGRVRGRLNIVVDDIANAEDNNLARAAAAFEASSIPQVIVGGDGIICARNEADRVDFGATTEFSVRFADPPLAKRAIRAALDDEGYAHVVELRSGASSLRRLVTYRRFRDPQTGAAMALCEFHSPPNDEAAKRGRLAHDLRSPLNAIQGFAEYLDLARDNLTADERSSYLADIQMACAGMLTIVETIVSDAAPVSTEGQVDIGALAQSVARLHLPRAKRAHRQLIVAVDGALSRPNTDVGPVRRILDNLIDNALRHGAGDVNVIVSATGFEVRDDGPGASPDIIDSGAATIGRSGHVSGFGLSNCRSLAAEIGAEIRIATAPGAGFSARLIFGVEDSADAGVDGAPQSEGAGARET